VGRNWGGSNSGIRTEPVTAVKRLCLVVVNQRYGRQLNFKKRDFSCLNANIHAATPKTLRFSASCNIRSIGIRPESSIATGVRDFFEQALFRQTLMRG
jgi:hypothetical protein